MTPPCPTLVAFHRELTNIFGEYRPPGLYSAPHCRDGEVRPCDFFFNGGAEQVFPGEDLSDPSQGGHLRSPAGDERPEVTEEAVKRIESGNYDVIILNFANCDMVGHTGVFEAAVKAVEAVDTGWARWWRLPDGRRVPHYRRPRQRRADAGR